MRTLSNLVNDFLNLFGILSKLQQKIFRLFHWFSKNKRNIYIGIPYIAEKIGCSERTVKRATAYFQQMGWICKVKRCYRSNLYYMTNELIKLNLDDKKLFNVPSSVPENGPILGVLKTELTISTTEQVRIYKNQPKPAPKEKEIPQVINVKGIAPNDQQRLANQFSEYALVRAMEEARWYVRQGNQIRSLIAYIRKAAERLSLI